MTTYLMGPWRKPVRHLVTPDAYGQMAYSISPYQVSFVKPGACPSAPPRRGTGEGQGNACELISWIWRREGLHLCDSR
jgi:hypothetical protein